ncbi:hypothetical protein D3C86_2228300 [compost metagenome]
MEAAASDSSLDHADVGPLVRCGGGHVPLRRTLSFQVQLEGGGRRYPAALGAGVDH